MRFETLRYRYRASKRWRTGSKFGFSGPAKSLMDVSQVDTSEMDSPTWMKDANVHRPIKSCTYAWVPYYLPIGIFHYVGSWESYNWRDDARSGTSLRNRAAWEKKALGAEGGPDDFIRPWLRNFVDMVGERKAEILLQGAGELPPKSNFTNAVATATHTSNRSPNSMIDAKKTDDSFSACILILDENHRLSEWLAYHYYLLPLRYLVVAIDPHSVTSPTRILDKWRSRIDIVEWTDANFTINNLLISEGDPAHVKTRKHRNRQNSFYPACMRHLKDKGRGWTAFHDVDEVS